MTENDGVLFTRNNFDEHLEEDIMLLQEWYVCLDILRRKTSRIFLYQNLSTTFFNRAKLAYNKLVDSSEKLLNKINVYRLRNFKSFYVIVVVLIAILITQVMQYNHNQKLNEQLKELKHQILINNLELDINHSNASRTLGSSELFNLIKQNNNNSESDIHFNALVRLNEKVYILNKKLNETAGEDDKVVSFFLI